MSSPITVEAPVRLALRPREHMLRLPAGVAALTFATLLLELALTRLNAVVILVVLEVVLHVPVSLQLNAANFRKLSLIYIASAIPFFLTGLLLASLFAR